MKNKNLNTNIDLKLVKRNSKNLTFYISKVLLIDYNKKSNNFNFSRRSINNLKPYDYFELNLNLNTNLIDIYKPHYIGLLNARISRYLDCYIIEKINNLAGKKLIK